MNEMSIDAKTICDFLAWKAAKDLKYDTTNFKWHLGFQNQGFGYCHVIVYTKSRRSCRRFEALRGSNGMEILCPATSDPNKILTSILEVARYMPIYASGIGSSEILSQNPSLERLLLEMDLEGWSK